MRTITFNQYQNESGSTEKYRDNHRLVANVLGMISEACEAGEDLLEMLREYKEENKNCDLQPLTDLLEDVVLVGKCCGVQEKNIRRNAALGLLATPFQEECFEKLNLCPSPERIEHFDGELGDVLFHVARAGSALNLTMEHTAIKNRWKLSNRNILGELLDHLDH